MAEPTMNKADVKLRYKTLAAVDWAEIKTLAGVGVPALAKVLWNDAKKLVKEKKAKTPDVKVGLIKANLYFRIKDGDTHIGDVLLAKNWQGGAAALDAPTQRQIDDFVEDRKDLQRAVLDGQKHIGALLKTAAPLEAQLAALLKAAQTEVRSGYVPSDDSLVEAGNLVREVQKLHQQAQSHHDDHVFPIYSRHRAIKGIDGVDPELISEWGSRFYLLEIAPKYQKIDAALKAMKEQITRMAEDKKAMTDLIASGQTAQDNQDQTLTNLASRARAAFQSMQKCFVGTHAIDQLAFNLQNDIAQIAQDLAADQVGAAQGRAANNAGKVKVAGADFKKMEGFHNQLKDLLAELKSYPKPALQTQAGSQAATDLVALSKQADTFAKARAAELKTVLLVYNKLMKSLSAKKTS